LEKANSNKAIIDCCAVPFSGSDHDKFITRNDLTLVLRSHTVLRGRLYPLKTGYKDKVAR
jgi:hypothetical protein